MNLLSIIKASVLRKLRDRKALIFMILLPIILIGTYGIVFENIINPNKSIGEIKIGVVSKGSNLEKEYVDFINNIKSSKGFSGVYCEVLSDVNVGKKVLSNSKIDLLVEFERNDVNLLKNNSKESLIAESITKDFIEKTQILRLGANKGEEKLGEINNYINKNYVEFKGINDKSEMKALDYFGITILMFVIFMGGTYGVSGIAHLKEDKGRRILLAPIKAIDVFIGEFLSASIFLIIQTAIVMCFSSIVFEVNYGRDPMILVPIILQCFFSVSLGMIIGSFIKVESVAQNIIIIITMFLSFASGIFFPISKGSLIDTISNIFPNKHILNSTFNIISGSYDNLIGAFLITIIVVIIFLLVTMVKYVKEEM